MLRESVLGSRIMSRGGPLNIEIGSLRLCTHTHTLYIHTHHAHAHTHHGALPFQRIQFEQLKEIYLLSEYNLTEFQNYFRIPI